MDFIPWDAVWTGPELPWREFLLARPGVCALWPPALSPGILVPLPNSQMVSAFFCSLLSLWEILANWMWSCCLSGFSSKFQILLSPTAAPPRAVVAKNHGDGWSQLHTGSYLAAEAQAMSFE